MNYKQLILVGSDENQIEYLNNQKSYINTHFPLLDIIVVDETHEYNTTFNPDVNRYPFILLLKNGSKKDCVNAKLNSETLLKWLVNNSVK